VRRGGAEATHNLETLARRVHELAGWHVEVYLDGADLAELEPRLARLPRVSIDHLGVDRRATPALLRLVEHGAKVNATGFGRVDVDVPATLRAIADVDPTALMVGTDLPSTRARRPFDPADLDLVRDLLGPTRARAALHDTATAWYCDRRRPIEPQTGRAAHRCLPHGDR